MSWRVVPLLRREFKYFDRQKDLFSGWMRLFDEEWKVLDNESRRRFERCRAPLDRMTVQPANIKEGSPYVTDPDGNKKLLLRFDCSQFNPGEITIKTQDRDLTVHAKRSDDGADGQLYQEFFRTYSLPKNVDPKTLKSILSKDGVLQIEAPVPRDVDEPIEHTIPIEILETSENDDNNKSDNKQTN